MNIFLMLFVIGNVVLAKPHRQHGAHVHGAGTLGIVFDKNVGKVDLKISSESIFGFEYKAKSEKDKSKMQQELDTLDKKMSEIISFENSLKCQILKEKIDVVFESDSESEIKKDQNLKVDHHKHGKSDRKNKKHNKHGEHNEHNEHSEHSEVHANFSVTCEKSPLGTKIVFQVQKFFPKIKNLEVQVLIDDLQKSIEINKNDTFIHLK